MKNRLFISAEIYANAGQVSRILKEICEKIDESNFDVSKYSSDITYVGIIVNCFPDDLLIKGWGKPRKYISYKNGSADIRLPVPYVEFMNADYDMKYLMIVKNIIDSIELIGKKCIKSKRAIFDSDSMIDDILLKLNIQKEKLNGIIGVIQVMPT